MGDTNQHSSKKSRSLREGGSVSLLCLFKTTNGSFGGLIDGWCLTGAVQLLFHLTKGTGITEADKTAVQKPHSGDIPELSHSLSENGHENYSLCKKHKTHQACTHEDILLADER